MPAITTGITVNSAIHVFGIYAIAVTINNDAKYGRLMGESNEKDATTASNGNDAITDPSVSSDAPFRLG